jgi:hypothetical protein
LQALRDWHCYRRYDLAALHFEKAMQIAKPSERPFTYSAYKCTHGKTWKLNVRRWVLLLLDRATLFSLLFACTRCRFIKTYLTRSFFDFYETQNAE